MTGTYGSPPPGEGALLAAGRRLAGRFRVVGLLGRGAVGEVYEAEDLELGGVVAVKVLRSDLARDPVALARFRREIQLARRVSHPNVCRVYDVFRDVPPGEEAGAEGLVFLTMERLRGETLRRRLQRQGRLPPEVALAVLAAVGEGLAEAHGAGVVHRDLKSGNVFLEPKDGEPPAVEPGGERSHHAGGGGESRTVASAVDAAGKDAAGEDAAGEDAAKEHPLAGGRVVIADFGLARSLLAPGDAALTATGELVGSPAYMAPEQVRGEAVTAATDVYALGVMAYELVTGELPFRGNTAVATALRRLTDPPPSPRSQVPELDPAWEAAILACLERDPASRPSDPRWLARRVAEGAAVTGSGGGGPAAHGVPREGADVDPEAVRSGATAPVAGPAADSGSRRDLGSSNPSRRLPRPAAAGVGVAALLALLLLGWLVFRGLGSDSPPAGTGSATGTAAGGGNADAAAVVGPADPGDDPQAVRAAELEAEGRSRLGQGDPAAAVPLLAEAVSLWRTLGRREREAAATYQLGLARRAAGDEAAGMALLERAVDLFREAGEPEPLRRALVGLGAHHFNAGDMGEARHAFEEALVVARQEGDDGAAATALRLLSHSLRMEGDLSQAERALVQAREIHRQQDDASRVAAADVSLAALHSEQGRLEEARRGYRAALERLAGSDAERTALAARGGLAEVALLAGDLEAAAEEAEAALAGWRALGEEAASARARVLRGRIALADGRLAEAEQDLEAALEVQATAPGNSGIHETLASRAALLRLRGDLAAAREDLQRALARARDVGAAVGGAALLCDLAELALDEAREGRGVPAEAEALARSALEIYRRAASGSGEARARTVLARALRFQGKEGAAERELVLAAERPEAALQGALVGALELESARLVALRGDRDGALRRLRALATRTALPPALAAEAKVEAAVLAPPAERRRALEQAAAAAEDAGYLLFARRARAALEAGPPSPGEGPPGERPPAG